MRAFIYRLGFIVVIFALVAISVYINRFLPDLPSVAGAYKPGDFYDRMIIPLDYHTPDETGSFDEIFLQATIHHEMMHSFKSMGVTDVDVPIAAAWGYLFEWRRRGGLTDNSKVKYFDEGYNAQSLGPYISGILEQYRGEFTKESPESYDDGARLAGAVYALFEDFEERHTMFYLMALGFRLNHESAVYAVENPQLFRVIFEFRRGLYFTIDQQQLNDELDKLSEEQRDRAIRYIEALNEDHRIGLVRDKAGIIDMSPPDASSPAPELQLPRPRD